MDDFIGVLVAERHRWEEKAIIEVEVAPPPGEMYSRDSVCCVARFEAGSAPIGRTYRWFGEWKTHPSYGRQFHVSMFVQAVPYGRTGVMAYLQEAPGIGPSRAEALWEAFASDAPRIFRESPETAAHVAKMPLAEAQAAAIWLREAADMEAVSIQLLDLLDGRGFPRLDSLLRAIVKKWGGQAPRMIRTNPYLLMQFRGIGWQRADKLWVELGRPLGRLKRQAMAAIHYMKNDPAGHTWFRAEDVGLGIVQHVGSEFAKPPRAVILAKRAGMVSIRRDESGGVWVAERKKAEDETTIADRIAGLLADSPSWPSVENLAGVSDHQKAELQKALAGKVGIFGGSPGTGKTYTVARLLRQIQAEYGGESVAVAAPTGKAAARMSEVLANYDVGLKATTIHSLLGVVEADEGGWTFAHTAGNPLEKRFVVIDEASMPSVDLLASLLRAIPHDGHLLLVGDVNQLPPVGHGAPLRDLLAAGLPQGCLTEIRRNSGAIVEACHQIRQGRQFTICDRLDELGNNLIALPAESPQIAVDVLIDRLVAMRKRGILDPVWDTTVICALNTSGPLSRTALNERIQKELNPHGNSAPGQRVREGDKVIVLKNALLGIPDEYLSKVDHDPESGGKVYVANGEIGRAIRVAPKLVYAEFSAPYRVVKLLGTTAGGAEESADKASWDLAYAVTCHKLQGSESPVCFTLLDPSGGAQRVCSREWLYTAISRAKRYQILIGNPHIAQSMIRRQAIRVRQTHLTTLVKELWAMEGKECPTTA